jgi:acrylyl-CoA reductase (NADPH)
MDLPTTVAPFILRGVILHGVNSVTAPRARRETAWQRLAQILDLTQLDAMTCEISLSEVQQKAVDILAGNIRGRLIVDVNRD